MNWADIPVFLAIAEAGTLAGAARTLGVNHSTVFRRLNALEHDVATRLFERLPTGYVPTPAGERMAELARQAADVVQTMDRELAGQDLAPSGTVRLTTAPNIARTLVPAAIRNLAEHHPRIQVEIIVGDSDFDLSRREADIALRATARPPQHLVGRKLMDLCWYACAASTLARPPQRFEELGQAPLIGADAALLRLDAFQRLETTFPDSIVARANDLSTMAALALAGIGVALLPADQNEPGLQRLFAIPGARGELWLLTHPDLRHVRRIQAVWSALAEAVGEHTTLDQPPRQ